MGCLKCKFRPPSIWKAGLFLVSQASTLDRVELEAYLKASLGGGLIAKMFLSGMAGA